MPRSPARAPFHALRSALVATTIVTLAAAAHVTAGGQLPVPAIMAAVLALTGLATTLATRLKLKLPAMASLLGAGQVLLHDAFTAFSTPGGGSNATSVPAPAHHGGTPAFPPSVDHLQLHELDSALAWAMLAGHALATLACALLLARGEDALWSLAAWLRPLVEIPAPGPQHPATVRPVPVRPLATIPLPWRNLRRDCRRGPPVAVVYA